MLETLSNDSKSVAQNVALYADLHLNDLNHPSDDFHQATLECYEIPFRFSPKDANRSREDAEVQAVRKSVHQADSDGLIGNDTHSEEQAKILINLDGRSILDGSAALWDSLVSGSIPFDFGDGLPEEDRDGDAQKREE
ncbi:hypothetical protein ED733_008438 [Metarhizium rileyi]|uniref:Uncharacterized protein n=1 Tax=Metarhizium rileyi (strain RCEF 4871) TaxID=1649241 RepID=A0A5C6GGU4_METRR|nr:hypothetical protein ED733_008438 [Metarhizium rileyi]